MLSLKLELAPLVSIIIKYINLRSNIFSGSRCPKGTENVISSDPPFIEFLAYMILKVSGTLDTFV